MTRRLWVGILVTLMFVIGTAVAQASVIVSPVGVASNTIGEFPGLPPSLSFDQSGLNANFVSGVTDFDAYMALNPEHSLVALYNEWWWPTGVSSGSIVYDLGAAYNLDRIAYWNEDAHGVSDVDVFVDGVFAGSFTPTDWTYSTDYFADIFSLGGTFTGRYVRFDLTGVDNWGAVGEVAFSANAVPEPATLILLGSGLVGLAMAGRRRK